MTKKEIIKETSNQITVKIDDFLENALIGKEKEIDYEKALSLGILFGLQEFKETTETSKYDSKAMAILSNSCEFMKEMCTDIKNERKDLKRKKETLWYNIIRSMTKNIKIQDDNENKGFFSFLHRNRDRY